MRQSGIHSWARNDLHSNCWLCGRNVTIKKQHLRWIRLAMLAMCCAALPISLSHEIWHPFNQIIHLARLILLPFEKVCCKTKRNSWNIVNFSLLFVSFFAVIAVLITTTEHIVEYSNTYCIQRWYKIWIKILYRIIFWLNKFIWFSASLTILIRNDS